MLIVWTDSQVKSIYLRLFEVAVCLAAVGVARWVRVSRPYDAALLISGRVLQGVFGALLAADEFVLCEGETVHLVVGRDMKRREMPERYAEKFQSLLHGDGPAKESKE